MGCLLDADEQLQAISALRCTSAGLKIYNQLKEEVLSLNHKSGPQSFTLAPNSTVCRRFCLRAETVVTSLPCTFLVKSFSGVKS